MTIAEISEKKKDILAASAQTKSPFFEESRPSSPRNHSVFTWFHSWLRSCMKLVQLFENFRQNPDTDRTLQTIVLYVRYKTYFLKRWNLSKRKTCLTSYRFFVRNSHFLVERTVASWRTLQNETADSPKRLWAHVTQTEDTSPCC